MPWVCFSRHFDWPKSRHVVTAYKAGMKALVSQSCRDAAVGQGAAVDAEREADVAAPATKVTKRGRKRAS
jgi:hypothetical protein